MEFQLQQLKVSPEVVHQPVDMVVVHQPVDMVVVHQPADMAVDMLVILASHLILEERYATCLNKKVTHLCTNQYACLHFNTRVIIPDSLLFFIAFEWEGIVTVGVNIEDKMEA